HLLNANGEITLTFIEKEFGEALPFTDTGFRFVSPLQVHDWLEKAKFKMIKITDFLDAASSKDGKKLNRPYHIAQAFKSVDFIERTAKPYRTPLRGRVETSP